MNSSSQIDQVQEYREVSLIELAKILVKRRKVFYLIFAVIFFAGLVFALMLKSEYRYTSIYKVGSAGEANYLEPIASFLANVKNQYVPEYIDNYRETNEQRPPFGFNIQNPQDSDLIVVASDTTKANVEAVRSAHNLIIERIKSRESDLASSRKARLESRLNDVESLIAELRGMEDSGPMLASAVQKSLEIQAELAAIKTGSTLAVARESLDKVSFSRALVGILTVMSAFILGIFGAFIAEFISSMRKSMDDE